MNKDKLYNMLLVALATYTVVSGGSMPATILAIGLITVDIYSKYVALKEVKNLDAKLEERLSSLEAQNTASITKIEQFVKDRTSSIETKLAAFGMIGSAKRNM